MDYVDTKAQQAASQEAAIEAELKNDPEYKKYLRRIFAGGIITIALGLIGGYLHVSRGFPIWIIYFALIGSVVTTPYALKMGKLRKAAAERMAKAEEIRKAKEAW